MRALLAGLALAAILACGACDEGGDGARRPAGAEGVPVVESPRPAWSPGSGWVVGDVILEVGSEADPLFDVVGALRRPGGGVVVAEGSTGAVRFYGPGGATEGRGGGAGDGPGEFRILQALGRLAGDTVWAYDFSLGRVTLFVPGGGTAGVLTLEPIPARGLAGPGPRGEGWLVTQAWGDAPAGALTEGVRRDSVAVLRYGPRGRLRDTVAILPGREILITSEDGRAVMGPAPFGRNAAVAAWGDGVATGDQVERRIALRDSSGAVRRVVRWGGEPLEIGGDDEEAWRRARTEDLPPDQRARVLRDLEDAPLPERRPAHGPLLEGRAGDLWVARYALPGRTPSAWDVLSSDGRWLGAVAMPPGFRLLEAGEDWVLGVTTDPVGVERVTLRALARDR